MTVAVQTTRAILVGSADTYEYPFAFRVDQTTQVAFYENGVLRSPTRYTLTLNADQAVNPGGSFIVPLRDPVTDGTIVTIERVLPAQQSLSLPAYNPFPATSVEKALDLIWMMLQMIVTEMNQRLVQLPRAELGSRISGEAQAPVTMPAMGDNYLLAWKQTLAASGLTPAQFILQSLSPADLVGIISPWLPAGGAGGGFSSFALISTHTPNGVIVDFKFSVDASLLAAHYLVFMDRVLQVPGDDYTVYGTGTTLTVSFTVAPPTGSVIRLYC